LANLKVREYPGNIIIKAIKKAEMLDCYKSLAKSNNIKQEVKTIPFLFSYNPFTPNAQHIFDRNLAILQSSKSTSFIKYCRSNLIKRITKGLLCMGQKLFCVPIYG
jgi:hypothetical protein